MNDLLMRTWGILSLATKRLVAQKWLSLSILVGLAFSIALAMSIPLYSDGVYYRILTDELSKVSEGSRRPPFVFLYQYIRTGDITGEWENIQPVDTYLSESGANAIGLPQKTIVRYFRTDDFKIFPQDNVHYEDTNNFLFWSGFAFASEIENHINILEGEFPADAISSQESTIEVLIHENLTLAYGLQVGESYIAYAQKRIDGIVRTTQIPVTISGVWSPIDPSNDYWFYDPDNLKNNLLTTEGTFFNRLSPYLENEIYTGVWYLILDGSKLDTSDVNALLERIDRVQFRVTELLPNTLSPPETKQALSNYRQDAAELNFLLYAFSIPIFTLMIVFISLVVGLSVARQQNEIAILRSRGGSQLQLIGIAALEAFILGMLAFVIAIPLAIGIAFLVSNTQSFLNFSLAIDMRIALSATVIKTGMAAVVFTVIAQVLPTVGASLYTIVTHKQEQARSQRPPWWQRVWLDILLLIPVIYGIYLMQQQGSILALPVNGVENTSSFQNPLFLLIPSLSIFSFTLLILRILPHLMSLIVRLTLRTKSIGLLMAARHLARTPSFYSAPLILLILTFALSAFISSMAQTLDQHLYSQYFYAYGGDMNLVETGQSATRTSDVGRFTQASSQELDQGNNESEELGGPRFFFLPVEEHLNTQGVEQVTRVGSFLSFINVAGQSQKAMFLGVDRANFSSVAFWRDDFANVSLGELMNRLAIDYNGVLVNQQFLSENSLKIGDSLSLKTQVSDLQVPMDVKIVGVVESFPTWYPRNDDKSISLLVGNLDYLFEQAGGTYPYDVWLRTSSDVDFEGIVREIKSRGIGIVNWDAPLLNVALDQRQPERQGLFGMLSVGFLAAIFLSVLGIFLYSFFSFRRRFVELGVLRAIGLSSKQMTRFLAWELLFLIFIGVSTGTGLGITISNLFVPFFQVGQGLTSLYPPFVVEISWGALIPIYILYGVLFLVALGTLVLLMLRIRIFEAVKLGETT